MTSVRMESMGDMNTQKGNHALQQKKWIPAEWIWGVVITGFVLFSMAPAFYELSRAGDIHPERHFELVHNFYTDYNFYLSRIREGLEGRWTVTEKYTSEPHAGSVIHELYVLMGQVGRVVRVPMGRAGDVYHVARVVFAIALLVLIAEFSKKSFSSGDTYGVSRITGKNEKKYAMPPNTKAFLRFSLLAFLLAVTASSWPTLVAVVHNRVVPAVAANSEAWRFGGYMSWWSVMDSLQRITFIPHLLAGQALMVFLVMALTSFSVLQKTEHILFLGFLAFILGMIFPPGLVCIYGIVGVYGFLTAITEKKINWGMWTAWGAIFLISSAALLYLMLMTSVYPWKRLAELDVLHPLAFDYWEYFKAVGPVLPLGVAGLAIAVWRKEQALFPAVSWVLAWFVFLVLFHFVPQQSPLRFSEMIPHVPLGILTAYLFYHMGPWFDTVFTSHKGKQMYYGRSIKGYGKGQIIYFLTIIRNTFPIILSGMLVILGFLQMYSSYLWQKDFVDHKVRATVPLVPTGSYVMYPLKDFYTGMLYLEEHTKREDIILSETTAGNYIPVYSGNTVYVGHDNAVNAEEKKEHVRAFFSGQMDPAQASVWLAANRIRAVYFGPQEKDDGGMQDLSTIYPFLSVVYANSYVTIYTAP